MDHNGFILRLGRVSHVTLPPYNTATDQVTRPEVHNVNVRDAHVPCIMFSVMFSPVLHLLKSFIQEDKDYRDLPSCNPSVPSVIPKVNSMSFHMLVRDEGYCS